MTVADTNLLVHATVEATPEHARAFAALDREVRREGVAITRQILREYLAVLTRPQAWSVRLSVRDAMQLAGGLAERFVVLEDGPHVWSEFRILAERFDFGGKQVHDANIVATMLAHGVRRIVTFNARDFRRFEPLIEVVTP